MLLNPTSEGAPSIGPVPGFGSVSYSLFDTVSVNNLKLSKDIHLGANFHTNFAVISNTFGLIIQKLR